jgi:hypothetical protein
MAATNHQPLAINHQPFYPSSLISHPLLTTMPAEDEILEQMDPAVRQRVDEEYMKFAPFIGLVSAWKAAVEEHLSVIERNVTMRLAEQFFPQGDWRFPAQTLAVPQDLTAREFTMETDFKDMFTGATWRPCGRGWALPSQVVRCEVERGWDQSALVCEVRYEGKPDEPLLTPERHQLAFVRGSETVVAALAKARWAIQYPGKPFEPISVERYDGYVEFEREMSVARLTQRQLEAWLPPCYPYSRKFLRFSADAHKGDAHKGLDYVANADDWSWLREGGEFTRLVALIDDATADLLAAEGGENPLIFNAVPVAQMKVMPQSIVAPLHAVGETYKVPFLGVSNFFAATAWSVNERGEVVFHRASFTRTPHENPSLANVDVTCDQTVGEVRVFCECLGEDSNPGRDHPEYLSRGGRRFAVTLPSVGGMNVSLAPSNPIGRSYWYHSMLRPGLLTLGDVQEILSHLPACRAYFDLQSASVQLDVVNQPWVERTPWDNYLWPTVISEASLLEMRTNYLTRSRVPIIPVMRLSLPRNYSDVPAFLLDDIARYAASVLSQYFMIGWYRIEGQVMGSGF